MLRGERAWELLFQESDAEKIESVLADGRTASGQATERSWNAPGADLDTSWSALAIPNPGGVIEFVLLTGVPDESSTAPPSTRTSHSRLLANSPFEMWAFDRGTFRFLAINEATAHDYGYSQDELRSMRVLDVMPWEDVPRLIEMVTELGSGTRQRLRHRRKDRNLFEVDAEVVATESAGRPVCLVLSQAADKR